MKCLDCPVPGYCYGEDLMPHLCRFTSIGLSDRILVRNTLPPPGPVVEWEPPEVGPVPVGGPPCPYLDFCPCHPGGPVCLNQEMREVYGTPSDEEGVVVYHVTPSDCARCPENPSPASGTLTEPNGG